MWWQEKEFKARYPYLKQRSQILKKARTFFDVQGFEEVETPVLQVMASPDTHIHAFETQVIGRNLKPLKVLGLHTSPEIAMKKLLVAGMEKIYQICPVFRNAEEGLLHSPEFTMLEWYRTGCDYVAMMEDCEALVKSFDIPVFVHGDVRCDVSGDWDRITVAQAFERYAGIALIDDFLEDLGAFKVAAQSIGVRVTDGDRWDDVFHAVMAEKIEPFLGQERPCFLYEYPVSMAALARRKPDDSRYAERFELYICGVELANAFSELTDAQEQRARLEEDLATKKALYGQDIPIDEEFLQALEVGMPESTGCALGVDRLVMLASGAANIEDVLWAGKP